MAQPPKQAPAPDGQRIAKLLARAGIASRRDVERMIAEGRVALNGEVLTTPATILASLDGVTVDGKTVRAPEAARLFRYHKPPGLLTAARDPAGRPTIYDRLPGGLPRLMPVGRLDMNTEGLLLLTTDGELKREMELPSTGVRRTYRARAFGTISQEQLEDLINGITIEGVRYGAIDANLERRTGRNQWIEMSLTEGKNREVRRVLEHFELQVSRLIRTAYGPFILGDLPPGGVSEVRPQDVAEFRRKPGAAEIMPQTAGRTVSIGSPIRPRPAQPSSAAGAPGRPSPRRAEGGRSAYPADAAERPRPGRTRSDPPAAAQRPPRGAAKPKPAPQEAAAEKTARPKRGPGWAKAKPKASSRPTRRGTTKRQPTGGRPGGNKR